MCREIKFRVWDITDKCWINPNLLEVWDDSGKLEPFQFVKTGTLNPLYTPKENYVIQQYLGINDKIGKEMCEGDIVKWGMGPMYQIIWDETYAKFKFQTITNQEGVYILPEGEYRKSEICGNIFENPHYLERY